MNTQADSATALGKSLDSPALRLEPSDSGSSRWAEMCLRLMR